jgi:hypothetical protein
MRSVLNNTAACRSAATAEALRSHSAELDDRIGLTELRIGRLRLISQRLLDHGQEPIQTEYQIRNLERGVQRWRAQRQAVLEAAEASSMG